MSKLYKVETYMFLYRLLSSTLINLTSNISNILHSQISNQIIEREKKKKLSSSSLSLFYNFQNLSFKVRI